MAKKIYNKNAREAHLMAEAYQRVHNENAEGKRYQVLSIGGEHGQNSYVEAEFDDLNEVEMHLASQLDRHGIDIDDWKQGDFAGDLRTPDLWKREEGSGHLYLPIQGADGDDVYEVVDLGAAEDAEGDWAKNTPAGREDGNEPDNRNKGDTPWYDEKEAEDEQKELSHQDLIEWATQTGDGSLREEAYEALLAAYNEMERSKAALQAGQKPGGYYANM